MIEENFIDDVVTLHKNKNWLEIVEKYHDHPERNKVLWVFPSEENLHFLRETLSTLGCDTILSIGCGCGLLEWIITEATDLSVTCVEVDGAWWSCKYSPPTFLPLHLASTDLNSDYDTRTILQAHSNGAILFCYFNNRPAFDDYMKQYSGSVLVIIGPGEGRGIHTNPRPFNDVFAPWTLYSCQEVRDSKDYIAIYCRT